MRKPKSSGFKIPSLADVEARTVLPEDRYLFRIADVEQDEGDNGPYLRWTLEVAEGEYEGKKAKPYITSLAPQALWNLRGLLEALGLEIPDSAFELKKEDVIDLEVYSEIVHEDYQGRTQSQISGNFEATDQSESAPSKGNGKDETVYTQDDINEMATDELTDLVKEHDLDVDLGEFKTLRRQRLAIIDALEKLEMLE